MKKARRKTEENLLSMKIDTIFSVLSSIKCGMALFRNHYHIPLATCQSHRFKYILTATQAQDWIPSSLKICA